MKTENKGLTLIELLLTLSIVSIITMTVFQSTRYCMDVVGRANSNVNMEIIKIMRQMKRDLRSAFLISKKHPAISFMGTNSSVKFVSVVPLHHDLSGRQEYDLKEKRYYLDAREGKALRALKVSTQNLRARPVFGASKEKQTEQTLSSSIESMELAYFDGEEWQSLWNSLEQLPVSVRITLQFREGDITNPLEEFSTVIMLPGA